MGDDGVNGLQSADDDGADVPNGGMMDLEEMDRRICGDLVEKNRRLDELYLSQSLDNQIQIRIE